MIIAIDGFSEADNIKEISRLGIDWIGLDFVADSPRRVRQLASLSGMLPDSPLLECAGLAPGSRLMGVFRDEMPQTIVTSIYNFHLDLVRLEGEESTVLIDNLRRTVDPDIRRGLQIVKTLRIERREDLLRAADYAGHADYLLLDPVEAAQEWLTDWEAPPCPSSSVEERRRPRERRCPTSTIRASLATAWARRWNRRQGASTPPRSNDCWTTFDRI